MMTKVARMYYEQGLTQVEIADALDLSQASISRLLKRADKEHIVRVVINPPNGTYPEFEEALQHVYKLKEVIVADCSQDNDEMVLQPIGAAAAYYLENTIHPEEVVGISSWSATLLAMVDAMHPLPKPCGVKVVQILGGMGNPQAETHANRLTTRLASLVRGSAHFLPAPGVVGAAETRRVLLDDPFIREAVALFDQVTLALVGIGTVEPSHLLASSGNVFSAKELDKLRSYKAMGDLCLRFFDADGKPVITSLDERVISMSLEQLSKVRRCVGIAGGARKYEAIAAALKGRLINVLITDRFTAARLVSENRHEN